ncbi:MAG: hypothetical protein HY848_09490 [Betaproteobacteria bacterium]|nr:hypothetical protein [Betaproteobacteria bacterium]
MKRHLASLLFVVTAVTGGSALAQVADAALVNMVSGDVSYVSQAGTPGKVQPFMKLREGDRIIVAAGGQVRIVFFEGARQELWVGPASFRAGKTAAEAISGKAAETRNLPAGVAQRMARIPELIQYAKLGGGQLRGRLTRQQKASLDQQATLDQARAGYEKMRQDMPANDVTPELYLYAALYEFLLYDEMKVVVAEMRRKQPDDEDVKALDAWLRRRASR